MQIPRLTKIPVNSARGIFNYKPMKCHKPVKILYGLKPMQDTSVSKITLGINKSIKFIKNFVKSAREFMNN